MMFLTIMMIIITSMALIALLATCWFLRQVYSMFKTIIATQETLQRGPAIYKDLTRQVNEIHQTMGGVVNNLKAVGNQVQHLNVLAGYAIEEAEQDIEGEEQQQFEYPTQPPQILIEVRHTNKDGSPGGGPPQMITPEEMSEEMLEKFKTFKAVYSTVMSNDAYPSRRRPDLN